MGSKLQKVFTAIKNGTFGDCSAVHAVIDGLASGNDHYIVCADFDDYLKAQERVDETYRNQAQWTAMSISNCAFSGKFSSDRTIMEYCNEIWKVEAVSVPKPSTVETKKHSFVNLTTE